MLVLIWCHFISINPQESLCKLCAWSLSPCFVVWGIVHLLQTEHSFVLKGSYCFSLTSSLEALYFLPVCKSVFLVDVFAFWISRWNKKGLALVFLIMSCTAINYSLILLFSKATLLRSQTSLVLPVGHFGAGLSEGAWKKNRQMNMW